MVAWELIRSCNLACVHCRASSERGPYPGELTTEECFRVMDEIATIGKPVIILTGGEPLLRTDIFELAGYGTKKGFRVVMATNGTLITEENVKAMKASGIQRISVSLDGPDPETHDAFRKVEGAFEGSLRGIEIARREGLPFQINTTITRANLHLIEKIFRLAIDLGAVAHHIFLLVPTGRGKDLQDQEISALDYEKTLHWFYKQMDQVDLQLKATCAPHYYRILRQEAKKEGKKITSQTHGLDAVTRGCLGGVSFCFISHTGQVQPCGYLELNCGNVREKPFQEIWASSPIFQDLRNFEGYHGKCGRCEFRKVCGGCRARAYEISGNYMAEEPYCVYEPA
ncbi:MAG: heme b synthase [Deltaproteobacteria bacterium RBG_16_49_23]|nr:MAG: heme b synthase [Deltaproteobacteria bacterium RBG_16_49_23]